LFSDEALGIIVVFSENPSTPRPKKSAQLRDVWEEDG
jgi:hypothetical protein